MPEIHLRADNGQYVCAEGGGAREVAANRPVSGPWEGSEVEYAHSYGDASIGEPRLDVAIYDMLDEDKEEA